MKRPLKARYGAKERGHDLLYWEGAPKSPPSLLLGLSDKPPGYLNQDECWWPSVGCGPVDNLWALWWTVPDTQASRGGMVRSEVFLWPRHEVGQVEDLLPYLEELGQCSSIALPSPELMAGVVNTLLDPDKKWAIFSDLSLWPGVIAQLWRRLWPEARQAFSARVALSPPQGGESISLPWIFGIPKNRAPEWSTHRIIAPVHDLGGLSRAARFLIGQSDASVQEVLSACGLGGELDILNKIARAADRLDQMRNHPAAGPAIDCLRSLNALAPKENVAIELKSEAMRILKGSLSEASVDTVLALANIEPSHLPQKDIPAREVEGWVASHAAGLSLEKAVDLLKRQRPPNALLWWSDAVHRALSTQLSTPQRPWIGAALAWLGDARLADILRDLLPATPKVETKLFEGTGDTRFTKDSLRQIQARCQERKWSRLHAWALMQERSPSEALREQWNFPSDSFAGLEILVEALPGEAIIEEALFRNDGQLNALVAKRTAREPAFMSALDAQNPAWVALWSAHIRAKGINWPPGVDRDALGRDLINIALKQAIPDNLVVALARDLAAIALNHPERANLWNALGSQGREALLPCAAEALIQRCNAGDWAIRPEQPLANAVISLARRNSPSARLLLALFDWDIHIDEQEAIRWVGAIQGRDWAAHASSLGHAVLKRGWKNVAEELYRQRHSKPEFLLALKVCTEFLSLWQRFLLSLDGSSPEYRAVDDPALVQRVADIGAKLAPDQLDHVWERAKGESKHLPSYGTPATRWQKAAELASKGALKDGLLALVRELQREKPYNDDLKELERVLVKLSEQKSKSHR